MQTEYYLISIIYIYYLIFNSYFSLVLHLVLGWFGTAWLYNKISIGQSLEWDMQGEGKQLNLTK